MTDPCLSTAICWEPIEGGAVACGLCAHGCRIAEGRKGICGVRQNIGGELKTLVYGRLVAERPDPIEKKPLYHFLPGSITHSIATVGCNMDCANCQNYTISQAAKSAARLPGVYASPGEVVARARNFGAASVSCTYTEPTIYMEYALDLMREAKREGLKNIFVSNGFMTHAARNELRGLLDAANIDLKSSEDAFYKRICSAHAAPVMESIEELKAFGVWVEVTTLVIPGENDSEDVLRDIARFIKSVDAKMPWHVSGFHPDYKLLDKPSTTLSTLLMARKIGLEEGLNFVYLGNRPGQDGENTTCPECGKTVITRRGFELLSSALSPSGECNGCGRQIPGVFS